MFSRKILLYNLSSLEPYIDTETMDEHYNAHYKKYTDELNDSVGDINLDIVSILRIWSNDEKIRNNGGGFYNHTLYFENISPFGYNYNYSSDLLKNKINQSFGNYDSFLNSFKDAGMGVFGSGWAWLVEKDGVLSIAQTKNQDNPVMYGDFKVLLGMDVWEHAYYLKHKIKRADYIDDFFNVIDWRIVSNRLKNATWI